MRPIAGRTCAAPVGHVDSSARVEYRTEFGAFLEGRGARFKAPNLYPSNWMKWGLGRTGAGLLAIANLKEILVGVNVDSDKHPTWFHKLQMDKTEIEADLGFSFEWRKDPGNKVSILRIRRKIDTFAPEERPAAYAWMLEHMEAVDRVLRPRIRDLDDSDLPGNEGD